MHGGPAIERKRLDLSEKALARMKVKNTRFEIIVDPDAAYKLKTKQITEDDTPLIEILEIDAVFTDATKGMRASTEELFEAFGTEDEMEAAKTILKEGDLQLTQGQRKEMADKKRLQIIAFVAKNAVDPKTKLPHPPARIENALEAGNIRIDPYDNVDNQIKRVIKELQTILPISIEQVQVAVRMPAEYSGKCYGVVKRFGSIKKEQWTNDGYWIVAVQLPAGRQVEFMEAVESITKGRSEVKVMERSRLDV